LGNEKLSTRVNVFVTNYTMHSMFQTMGLLDTSKLEPARQYGVVMLNIWSEVYLLSSFLLTPIIVWFLTSW